MQGLLGLIVLISRNCMLNLAEDEGLIQVARPFVVFDSGSELASYEVDLPTMIVTTGHRYYKRIGRSTLRLHIGVCRINLDRRLERFECFFMTRC